MSADPKPQARAKIEPPLVCVADFEAAARERVPHMAWEYLSGGAGDENSVRWNREAFERIRLFPRVLVDVSRLDTGIELFGQTLPFPILLAPVAAQRLFHPEGEVAAARGAAIAGATFISSTLASTSIEEIAAAAQGPLWFQLYVQPDRGYTRELIARAEAAGCRALCVTVDTPVVGARNREARAQFVLPPGMGYPNLDGLPTAISANSHRPGEGDVYSTLLSSDLTWIDVEWLLSFAKVPVLLKGILHPDDADRAIKTGVAGLIVSNHGGRNLDTVPATLDALPAVAERVAGRVPLLADGGIRRGTDVLKCLALGANAVLIGRPYLYGLAVAGDEGVARVVNILRGEFEMAMALVGCPSIGGINRSILWPS
jgi:4-hydroxymandelate oxidase